MTKIEAIAWIHAIQNGAGLDLFQADGAIGWGRLPSKMRESLDGSFSLGAEYGAIIALVVAFEITRSDLEASE